VRGASTVYTLKCSNTRVKVVSRKTRV